LFQKQDNNSANFYELNVRMFSEIDSKRHNRLNKQFDSFAKNRIHFFIRTARTDHSASDYTIEIIIAFLIFLLFIGGSKVSSDLRYLFIREINDREHLKFGTLDAIDGKLGAR